jgi:hypothetical protein
MYDNRYLMLLYDLTLDNAASGHTSPEENGNIRIEFTFKKALKQAITCLLYQEYYDYVLVDSLRNVTTDF